VSSFGEENSILSEKDQLAQKIKEYIRRHVKEGKLATVIFFAKAYCENSLYQDGLV